MPYLETITKDLSIFELVMIDLIISLIGLIVIQFIDKH